MDRSFLSDPAVVAASRSFVCARLATYECAAEEKLLESIFVGRSGDLENTTFTILAPDGKTKLARAGRGPMFAYGRGKDAASRMAADMRRIAKKHPGRAGAAAQAPLPLCEDVRLGLNVAACDGLPLVVVRAADVKTRAALQKRLAALAWSEAFVGRALYATASTAADLAKVAGRKPGAAFLVVQPGTYGLDGRVLAQASAEVDEEALRALLRKGLAAHRRPAQGDTRKHVREGKRAGVHWETEIPVTDPGRPPPGRR